MPRPLQFRRQGRNRLGWTPSTPEGWCNYIPTWEPLYGGFSSCGIGVRKDSGTGLCEGDVQARIRRGCDMMMTAAAPAPAPAPTGGVFVSQIQTPTQTQASGQTSEIGTKKTEETRPADTIILKSGPADDIFAALLEKLATPAMAPASGGPVSVTVAGGGDGVSLGDWLAQNKMLLGLGAAAVLAALYFRTLPKKGKK